MENRYFSNNATTTISSLTGTSLVVASAAKFPSQYPYFLTLETTALAREIVKVTASPSANTLTVVRAQEGTSQLTFASGDKAELRVTAGTLNGLNDKAERSGDTFTGDVKVQSSGSVGSVRMMSGNSAANPGRIYFDNSSGETKGMIQGSDTGLYILSQTNGSVANFDVSVPTGTRVSENFSIQNDSTKTTIKLGTNFIPRCLPAGSPLPTANVGPIWHDDYDDWMTWQSFLQNGANYVGYASQSIGRLVFMQPDAWFIPGIGKGLAFTHGVSLSKTTYAALWNWALNNGLTTLRSNWAHGNSKFADNGDGTFLTPDFQGEFVRIFDYFGTFDVDRGGIPGWQADAIRNITGTFDGNVDDGQAGKTGAFYHNGIGFGGSNGGSGGGIIVFDASRVVPTASENRPRNIALDVRIHY